MSGGGTPCLLFPDATGDSQAMGWLSHPLGSRFHRVGAHLPTHVHGQDGRVGVPCLQMELGEVRSGRVNVSRQSVGGRHNRGRRAGRFAGLSGVMLRSAGSLGHRDNLKRFRKPSVHRVCQLLWTTPSEQSLSVWILPDMVFHLLLTYRQQSQLPRHIAACPKECFQVVVPPPAGIHAWV
jgi:hypothetical protein